MRCWKKDESKSWWLNHNNNSQFSYSLCLLIINIQRRFFLSKHYYHSRARWRDGGETVKIINKYFSILNFPHNEPTRIHNGFIIKHRFPSNYASFTLFYYSKSCCLRDFMERFLTQPSIYPKANPAIHLITHI